MNAEELLRAILLDVLIDNFDVVNFEKTDSRFDIWLDEKKGFLLKFCLCRGIGEHHIQAAMWAFASLVADLFSAFRTIDECHDFFIKFHTAKIQ